MTLDTDATVAELQLGSGNALDFDSGEALAVAGTQIINAGNIALSSGTLRLENNVTLSGTGTLTLSGTANINTNSGGTWTLTNQSTIQGAGTIGQFGVPLVNQGTINADSSGNTLTLLGGDEVTNTTGTFEAANNGTLLVQNPFANYSGGTLAGGSYIANAFNGVTQGTATTPINAFGTAPGGGERVARAPAFGLRDSSQVAHTSRRLLSGCVRPRRGIIFACQS